MTKYLVLRYNIIKLKELSKAKEDGLQPFKDYEMAIISQKFNVSESELFF
ncbi:TPA: hypothetical protein VKC85_000947 [Streptococcus pyogenes]|nr:hypothetical protein [Streptococcus pyogenes]HER3479520.1 hypothetical protein [Streptococcus pyogenes]